jgi:hypothetical protein
VLATADLQNQIINYQVDRQVYTDSDYLPIHTLINIRTQAAEAAPLQQNWKAIDRGKIAGFVSMNL